MGAMTVALKPARAGVGALVTVEASAPDTDGVVQVLGEVVGYGLSQYLTRERSVWRAEVAVPYGAAPGEYTLEVRGIDGQGRTLASGRAIFHVIA